MSIVAIDPPDWEQANVMQIDSDASDNKQAIDEIEDWAAGRGFARTSEYWLRRILRTDGTSVFRGICFRLTREETQSAGAICEQNSKSLHELPVTEHHSDNDR